MTEYAIRLKDIIKSYNMCAKPSNRFHEALNPFKRSYHDVFYALKNVNVEIKEGEMIGFVGESGSGKSTMLKIITGVPILASGTMEIEGKVSVLLELGSGFNPEYPGYENIYLNRIVLGFSREEVDEVVDDIIEFANIGDHIHRSVKTYSNGTFVCLALVVAINANPDILVVDEAPVVGDLEFQLKCMEKFTETKNSGKTILFVSHDTSSIRRFCDRSHQLKNGKAVEYGDTMEVTTNYENFLKKKSAKTINRNKNQVECLAVPDIVDVVKTELLDKDKNPVDMLEQGEKLYVKVTYEMRDDTIKNLVSGIALRTVDSFYAYGLNTLLDGIKTPRKRGESILYLEYEKLGLSAGEYHLDVVVFEGNATVPLIYKTKYINLSVSGSYIGEGIVVLDHKWEEGIYSDEIRF